MIRTNELRSDCSPKKNTICTIRPEVRAETLICADLCQLLAVVHGSAHVPGFVGVFLPPGHAFISSLCKKLSISQHLSVRTSGIYTLLGDLVLLQCILVFAMERSTSTKKKKFYLLTPLHEANWNFYFCSSSEFSYLNVHYFYSDMQISSADPNLKTQLLYTC